jgi:amino acid adenylation domain-containing protein
MMTLGVAYDSNAIHSSILFDPTRAAPSFVAKVAALLSTVLDGIIGNSQQTLGSLEAAALAGDLTLFSPHEDIPRAVRRKAAAHCSVGSAQVESVYPCTPLQCQQIEAAVASSQSDLDQYIFHYNNCSSSLSVAEVRTAWERLVTAYPTLRSRIVSLGDHGTCCVTLRSGTGIMADSEESLAEYLTLDGDKPVRYGQPLCRLGVAEQQADGSVSAVLSIHRTIYDPWNISVIERALAKACAGEAIEPTQPCKSSLVVGHRACRAAARAARSRPVSNSVVHTSEAPQFPRPHAGTASLSGSHLSQIEGVFDTETLHAAWVLTLSRVTGSSSVSAGVYVDGRGRGTISSEMLEIPEPVGAVHPFSIDVSSSPTVAALLGSIRSWEAGIFAEPFPVDNGGQPQPTSAAAANVLIIDQSPRLLLLPRQEQPAVTRSRGHMSATPPAEGVLMVLRCTAAADNDKVEMDVRFDERAITPDAVDMVVAQFHHAIRQLASSACAGAGTVLADLPALSSRETALLQQWARELPPMAAEDDAGYYYIHDEIKQHATARPGAPAVCSWDGDLTHGELDDLSDRLAAFLLARHGVGPGVVVPYFLDKSVVAVVVMLGILKAGAALLPLDSNHPAERLQGIVTESGASVVLVVSALHDKVAGKLNNSSSSSNSSQKLTEINMALVHSLARETPGPVAPFSPSDLCYIIYTSGSSGKPKGVMVTHGNLTASAAARRELVGMGPGTRTLQYLNFIFDVAMFDVFLTLAAGGCVCLPSEAEWSSDVAGAVRRTRANFVFLTPSLATLLRPAECPTLDTLALTGEPCEAGVVELWRDRRVLNMYGPAEATVHSSGADVSHGSGRHHLDIGRAGGCVYWAVDPECSDRLVPIGCPGELVIYGPIVARGYLGDPGRTAAAFISAPAWAETMGLPSSGGPHRWYRTGDLVVQSPDGSMVYQGRKDTQVKLSGQRIELGEIEHHLLLRPAGSQWHVAVELVAPAGLDQDKTLVVFFADGADNGGQEKQQQLLPPLQGEAVAFRDTLAASVPPYMVPQFYVRLCKLPMTSSGKLDRATLRRLGGSLSLAELGRYSTNGAGISPPTPPPSTGGSESGDGASKASSSQQLEARLGQLWSEVLGIPQETIRLEDNFFRLGGSSIRATRLAHGARRAGIELGVPLVFECPTLGQMASAACWRGNSDGGDRNGPDQATALARRLAKLLLADGDFRQSCEAHAARRPGLGLSAGAIASVAVATDVQADMVAVGELDGQAWHNSMTVESAAAGGLEVAALQRACAAVVLRHELLRTTFVQHRDKLYQVVLRPEASEECAELVASGSDLARFHLQELSGDAASGQQRCHRLVLEVHHAHYDAIAMNMVLADLRAAYSHYTSNTTSTAWTPTPAPRFDALVAHVGALDPAPARRFWTLALAGSAMTRLVPTQPQAPATPYPCVDTVRLRVPMACVDVDVDVGSTGTCTPSSVVQAAWALLLARATGRRDVVFCAPHANRDVPGFADADRVPGLCLNFLPARARLVSESASESGDAPSDAPSGAATLGALIRQMHAAAVAAIPHRHLGFRTIVRECTSWPACTRYGSMLIYQNHDALRRAIRFGDRDCLLTPRGNFGRCADLLVEATPDEDVNGNGRELVVDLLFSRRSFTDAQVDWIARTLEAILRAVPTSLDVPVDQVGSSAGNTLPYPLSLHGTEAMAQMAVSASASSNGNGHGNGNAHVNGNISANNQGHVYNLVLQAWSRVGLTATKTADTDNADLLYSGGDCSMYNDADTSGIGGGDLVTTLLLAREYQRSGHQVTMQQLIDNPTMRAQAGLLTSTLSS